MSLFSFFKRKTVQKFNIDNERDPLKIIRYGILFEDTNEFLPWGEQVKELSGKVVVKEKRFADRTVYNWGEHCILNGLKLGLTTIYWNHQEESREKRFNSVECWVIGNDIATQQLKLIDEHLSQLLGDATRKEVSETFTVMEWMIDEVKIRLYFFKQYVDKLQFEIRRFNEY